MVAPSQLGLINGMIPQYIKKVSTACGKEKGIIKKTTRNGIRMWGLRPNEMNKRVPEDDSEPDLLPRTQDDGLQFYM